MANRVISPILSAHANADDEPHVRPIRKRSDNPCWPERSVVINTRSAEIRSLCAPNAAAGQSVPRPDGTLTPIPAQPNRYTFTLRRAAHNLETKRCLCGTWIKHRFVLEKKIPANLLD